MEFCKKLYYIEMTHENSEENYDLQSKWFETKKQALDWFKNNIDFISDELHCALMVANFTSEDSCDIDQVKVLN